MGGYRISFSYATRYLYAGSVIFVAWRSKIKQIAFFTALICVERTGEIQFVVRGVLLPIFQELLRFSLILTLSSQVLLL